MASTEQVRVKLGKTRTSRHHHSSLTKLDTALRHRHLRAKLKINSSVDCVNINSIYSFPICTVLHHVLCWRFLSPMPKSIVPTLNSSSKYLGSKANAGSIRNIKYIHIHTPHNHPVVAVFESNISNGHEPDWPPPDPSTP